MRRADVRKGREQVCVRPYLISRPLSIGEERKEEIYDVVGECPAIVRKSRRPRGIIVEKVRQQSSGDPRGFCRRISTGVLQRVREDGDETGIARGLRSKIGGVLLAGKEGSLIGPRTTIRLNPFSACAVQRASPQAHLFSTEGRVGYLQHDAAHVQLGEVIVTGELQVVQGAQGVEEKRIAA